MAPNPVSLNFQNVLRLFKTGYQEYSISLILLLLKVLPKAVTTKIKVLKRNAYGYRDFKRFRNRILHKRLCKTDF